MCDGELLLKPTYNAPLSKGVSTAFIVISSILIAYVIAMASILFLYRETR